MLMKYLITADNCPKCEVVREYLDEHPVGDLEIFNANTEMGYEMAIKYNVKSAPTLITFNDKDPSLINVISNSADIIEYFTNK